MSGSTAQTHAGHAPENIPAHDLANFLALVEQTCGNMDGLKQLCESSPELRTMMSSDGDVSTTLNREPDVSGAVYLVVSRAIATGNLNPLIDTLKSFKPETLDLTGKGKLKQYLDERRGTKSSASLGM